MQASANVELTDSATTGQTSMSVQLDVWLFAQAKALRVNCITP